MFVFLKNYNSIWNQISKVKTHSNCESNNFFALEGWAYHHKISNAISLKQPIHCDPYHLFSSLWDLFKLSYSSLALKQTNLIKE